MLRIIGFVLKFSAFAALVLVLGNWIRWDGKTLSDQIRMGMSQAEKSSPGRQVREWSGLLKKEAKRGASRVAALSAPHDSAPIVASDEEIPPTERQKLRALIRELNGARSRN